MSKNSIVAYCFGLASGFGIAYLTLKRHFQDKEEAAVESVKEALKARRKEGRNTSSENSKARKSPLINTDPLEEAKNFEKSSELATDSGYISYEDIRKARMAAVKEREEMEPRVINPDDIDREGVESGAIPIIELTYYADGVVTDENNEKFIDAEDYIGYDALMAFGRYGEDAVYVWNGRLRVYYEITKDDGTYAEVLEKYPYLKEEE